MEKNTIDLIMLILLINYRPVRRHIKYKKIMLIEKALRKAGLEICPPKPVFFSPSFMESNHSFSPFLLKLI
jgi:hypothetical protein